MQQAMVLGGYTFPVNPPTAQNPRVKAVVATEHLGGRSFTIWGTQASRRDITLTWPLIDAAMFGQLDTLSAATGSKTFVDEDGTSWTVIVLPPTYDAKTPTGSHYNNVTLKLQVVSQP